MALKRKTKITPSFSMASMTDIIFLLLLFFLISSTIIVPNSIKITLPQSQKQTAARPLARVMINKDLNYSVAFGNQREKQVPFNEITPFLIEHYSKEPDMFVALHADESVPYGEIVKILDIAVRNKIKMYLATRPPAR